MAMATLDDVVRPTEVATKVLRRAQVSQMTRALQSRLALANVKIKHGWENMSLETLEPKLEIEFKRKRPTSSNGGLSDISSGVSERIYTIGTDSSPLAPPLFSDAARWSGGSGGRQKRVKYPKIVKQPASSSHNRRKIRSTAAGSNAWKKAYRLPDSSPAYHRRSRYPPTHAPSLSFVSETSTALDDPASPLLSEDDDADLPLHSFQASSHFRSSPPRTPSPELSLSARRHPRTAHGSHTSNTGEEGADLLLFLATSPSPANANGRSNARRSSRNINPPSTPPSKGTPLPSSHMSTPGGTATLFGFGSNTPGPAGFNFSDYLNVTPSPGQVPFKTPGGGKTPLAAREARRRLNFDSLLPPSTLSPRLDRLRNGKEAGLGMDLGGELCS